MMARAPRRLSTVFLDADGVINDENWLFDEYIRLIGEVLAPALGGEPEDWGRANRVVFPRVWEQTREWRNEDPVKADRHTRIHVVRGMCEMLDVEPPDDDECARLTGVYDRHVRANGDLFFADSADVVRTLAPRYDVHMASGNDSRSLELMLKNLGVVEEVGIEFGPDLVDANKGSPDFYPRIFEATNTNPTGAVVVDDSTDMLALAAGLGAATVLVCSGPLEATHPVDAVITDIGQLPAAIRAL